MNLRKWSTFRENRCGSNFCLALFPRKEAEGKLKENKVFAFCILQIFSCYWWKPTWTSAKFLMFEVECDFWFEVTQKIFSEFSVNPIKLYQGQYTNGEQIIIIDNIEKLWQYLALLWYLLRFWFPVEKTQILDQRKILKVGIFIWPRNIEIGPGPCFFLDITQNAIF